MNKARYYELKDRRTGVPFHWTHRFLERHIDGQLFYINRDAIIHIVMSYAFMKGDDIEFKKWNNIFQSSIHLLDAARMVNENLLDSFIYTIGEEHIHYQSNLRIRFSGFNDLLKSPKGNRAKFVSLMGIYTELYEGYFRCVSSVPILAKMILNNMSIPKDLKTFINDSVTSRIKLLNDDTGDLVPALPELCRGCNVHLRNGIAHKRWQMIERNKKIEIWDMYGGKVNWKQRFTIDSLKNETYILRDAVQAIDLAVLVYTNSRFKERGGLFMIGPGFFEDDVLKDAIENIAFDFGLFVEECQHEEQDGVFKLHLYVPTNLTIPQESEIIEGSTPPKVFKVKIDVIEEKVNNAVLNCLKTFSGALKEYPKLHLKITDEKKGELGSYVITSDEMTQFFKGNNKHIELLMAPLASHMLRNTVTGPSYETFQ